MTEEEKQSEREYKKEAEDRLKTLCHNLSIYNYALDNTDVRIREYIESVALDTEGIIYMRYSVYCVSFIC